jgi:hypothetical protein
MGDPRHLLREAGEVHGGSASAIVEFRRYKITDSAAIREFYSLLRAAIKGAKGIGKLNLLINDQTVPKIRSKMPYTDWKEWATKRPDWMQENMASAFREVRRAEVARCPEYSCRGTVILGCGKGEDQYQQGSPGQGNIRQQRSTQGDRGGERGQAGDHP